MLANRRLLLRLPRLARLVSANRLKNNQNLNDHLLSGLETIGVPNSLSGSILPFTYNKIDELEALINAHDIGVVVMEVMLVNQQTIFSIEYMNTISGASSLFDECNGIWRHLVGFTRSMKWNLI